MINGSPSEGLGRTLASRWSSGQEEREGQFPWRGQQDGVAGQTSRIVLFRPFPLVTDIVLFRSAVFLCHMVVHCCPMLRLVLVSIKSSSADRAPTKFTFCPVVDNVMGDVVVALQSVSAKGKDWGHVGVK